MDMGSSTIEAAKASEAALAEPMPRAAEPDNPITLDRILQSPLFKPIVLMGAAIMLMYWALLQKLPTIWLSEDGYYSHGFLVPLISGYVIYRWWPRLRGRGTKTGWLGLAFLVPILYLGLVANLTGMEFLLSVTLLASILCSIWFVAGFHWMLSLSLPVLYLGFALPLWTMAIYAYTNPLQILSTKAAYVMLDLAQFEPWREDATTIRLPHFTLDVGVPCSGLKLLLAVTAFTAFFMMIGNLRWWANVLMVGIILPLCLFINGLRIALIGVVGEMYGPDAGHKFHDYSGYITLLICFFILFKFARLLGWKD
jgi:exosortase